MEKKSTESVKQYSASLARENKFDPTSLPANRGGKFSAGQRTKLYLTLVSMFLSSLAGVGIGILSLYYGWVLFPKEEPFTQWNLIFFSLILFVVGVLWIFESGKQLINSWQPLLMDVLGGILLIENGKVSKYYDDTHYKTMWHRLLDWVFSYFSNSSDQYSNRLFTGTYFYLLKEMKFIVSKKGFNTLDEEITHHLYFTPKSKRLINMEPVYPDTPN